MQKRYLKDLDLLDDFLFYTMTNHPKYGEKFSRLLLQIIFKREFKKLKIVPQKTYYGSDTDKHGARLDLFIEEELEGEKLQQNATICDIEPEQKLLSKDIKVISRRVRYYHAIIDSDSLQSGLDYKNLKNVIVIMIMPFDPFGYDHIIYTIKNTCLEVPELPYEDGARTLFLYTKGTKGDCGEELKELLRYMEHSVSENANCNAVKEIHDMVEHVKQDAEVSLEYMKVYEKERMLIEEGIEQGIEQGIERGIEQGRQQAESEFEAERLKLEEEIRLLRKELAEQQKIR